MLRDLLLEVPSTTRGFLCFVVVEEDVGERARACAGATGWAATAPLEVEGGGGEGTGELDKSRVAAMTECELSNRIFGGIHPKSFSFSRRIFPCLLARLPSFLSTSDENWDNNRRDRGIAGSLNKTHYEHQTTDGKPNLHVLSPPPVLCPSSALCWPLPCPCREPRGQHQQRCPRATMRLATSVHGREGSVWQAGSTPQCEWPHRHTPICISD